MIKLLIPMCPHFEYTCEDSVRDRGSLATLSFCWRKTDEWFDKPCNKNMIRWGRWRMKKEKETNGLKKMSIYLKYVHYSRMLTSWEGWKSCVEGVWCMPVNDDRSGSSRPLPKVESFANFSLAIRSQGVRIAAAAGYSFASCRRAWSTRSCRVALTGQIEAKGEHGFEQQMRVLEAQRAVQTSKNGTTGWGRTWTGGAWQEKRFTWLQRLKLEINRGQRAQISFEDWIEWTNVFTELSDFLAAGQFRQFLNLKNRIKSRNTKKLISVPVFIQIEWNKYQ